MRRPPKLEWMGLMDVIGPFVTPAIVAEAFPSGLEGHDSGLLKGLRSAYKSWEDSDDPVWHREWVNVVLSNVLGYQEKHILQDQAIPESINYVDRTHHTTIRPTFIIHQPEFPDRGRILVMRLPKGESTSKPKAEAKWQASPISQMQMLLQANNEKVGLVTNGEEWVLVNNSGTGAVGFATWYAYLWLEEHDTLRSFRSLLSIRRVFGGEPGSRLVDLLAKGAEDQQDVTDRLGYQVRRAVEELVGAFERLDRDSHRELLKGVGETEVYEGVLTVMMRLVFLFCAEERGLLHLGEDLYDRFYAVSTLREQLHDDASKLTEEVLDRRSSAWCRLLATFRMVYQGVAHEDLRIPAYGGTLFDPDRFPWLEGRQADGTNEPPHVSDRIVLHLLDSLQVLRQGQEARKLSFHALDVEQIGHVYEGLLDHTAKRALKPILGLVGKEGDEPEVDLETLQAKVAEGRDKFTAYLKDQTGKTERALGNLLDQATDAEKLRKLRVVCGDDHDLFERVKPFANLIREDSFGNVQVYPEGALYATVGSDRRSTGTHYTPRTLTEEVVKYALEPLVYVGPAEGLSEEEWTLKDAKAIVDLKVCDMAMGSGAFLVAACRFLSIKLVEAWAVAEEKAARRLGFSAEGHFFTHRLEDDHHAKTPGTYVTTPYGDIAVADPSQELIPNDAEERLALARRIVADRCLYGVDRNAMAVEMAKLSLWLTTLRKDRPFTFLDHALRHGDSLLGVTERQLEMFSMDTSGQSEALLLPWVPEYVEKVRNLRQQIARIPSHDPEAIRRKQRLFDQVRDLEKPLKFAADALVSIETGFGASGSKSLRKFELMSRLGDPELVSDEARRAGPSIPTFHWHLEFPDVLLGGGFSCVIGNPPYLFGESRPQIIPATFLLATGQWDACWLFVERALDFLAVDGTIGYILPDSILARSEPKVLRDHVEANTQWIRLLHAGSFFNAAVSVFALMCGKSGMKQSFFKSLLSTDSPDYHTVEFSSTWLPTSSEIGSDWRPISGWIDVSRGEEAGKSSLSRSEVGPGLVPVVAGEGIESPIVQPRATHYLHGSLVSKRSSNYSAPKLVALKTGQRIRAAVDDIGLVTLQSVYNIKPTGAAPKWVNARLLAALLSSDLINETFILPITSGKGLFPQITQQMIRDICLPELTESEARTLDEAVVHYLQTPSDSEWDLLQDIIRQTLMQPRNAPETASLQGLFEVEGER